MGGIFRSEDMTYVTVMMNKESADHYIRLLGKFGMMHFEDLNGDSNTASLANHDTKKRLLSCQMWVNRLGYLRDTMEEFNVDPPSIDVVPGEVKARDVLETVQDYVETQEKEIEGHKEFLKQTQADMESLQLRKVVLTACIDHWQLRQDDFDDHRMNRGQYNSFGDTHTRRHEMEMGFDTKAGDLELGESQGLIASEEPELNTDTMNQFAFHFSKSINGVIPASNQSMFERMLFRVSRGNAYVRFVEMPEQNSSDFQPPEKMSIFSIVYLGTQLRDRIEKICKYFGAQMFAIPTSDRLIANEIDSISIELADLFRTRAQTLTALVEALSAIAYFPAAAAAEGGGGGGGGGSPWVNLVHALNTERAVLDIKRKCFIASASSMVRAAGWIPTDKLPVLQGMLDEAADSDGGEVPVVQAAATFPDAPPTFFRTNAVTGSFQGIVDTYGIARYQEVNPGLFTIVSFPFLFGVMYGDIFHGSMMLLASIYMLYNEKRFLEDVRRGRMSEIPSMIFAARYLLVAMAAFAVYCGTIYNDCASIPIRMFASTYTKTELEGKWVYTHTEAVYPWGVDPAWYHTDNQLAFFNSLKMKLSVCLGVVHMVFGLVLSAFNHLHNKDPVGIYYEFIPRLVFMLATFGYMIFMIILKWSIDWQATAADPPNLIQSMIKMFLSPTTVEEKDQLYTGQVYVQCFMLLCAFVSVPTMLMGRPLIEKWKHEEEERIAEGRRYSPLTSFHADQHADEHTHILIDDSHDDQTTGDDNEVDSRIRLRSNRRGGSSHDDDDDDDDDGDHPRSSASRSHRRKNRNSDSSGDVVDYSDAVGELDGAHGHGLHGHGGYHPGGGHGAGEFDFSESMIYSGIHTIEYVLGAVSNTASYLRLWALSLAHAQLSDVFWDKMIMMYGINTGSTLMTVCGMAAWVCATGSVLLAMDVLECFLHALRLHWVEFQNKFFNADGYAFVPFVLKESWSEQAETLKK